MKTTDRPHRDLPSDEERIAVWTALTLSERKDLLTYVFETQILSSESTLAEIRGERGDQIAADPTSAKTPMIMLAVLGRALYYNPELIALPNRLEIIKKENPLDPRRTP